MESGYLVVPDKSRYRVQLFESQNYVAIFFINKGDKPTALRIFSKNAVIGSKRICKVKPELFSTYSIRGFRFDLLQGRLINYSLIPVCKEYAQNLQLSLLTYPKFPYFYARLSINQYFYGNCCSPTAIRAHSEDGRIGHHCDGPKSERVQG